MTVNIFGKLSDYRDEGRNYGNLLEIYRKFFRRKIENKKRTFRKRRTRGEIERQRRNINTRGKKKVIRVVKINKEKKR